MNDFQGLLSGDYGFKPQGKSAPMAPPRSNPNTSNPAFDFDLGASTTKRPPYSSKSPAPGVFLDDQDDIFSRPSYPAASKKNSDFSNLGGLDEVYGRGSKSPANSSVNLDSVFGGPVDSGSRFSSLPVFDKPVYDDDAFDDVPGLKNSSSAKYPDVFSSSSTPQSKKNDAFDDLLGGFARKEPESKGLGGSGRRNENDVPSFDDLLPGFGRSRSPSDRNPAESNWDKRSTVNGSGKAPSGMEDPFVVLNSSSSDAPPSQGFYSDPLEQFSELGGSGRKKPENVSASGAYFDDIDPLVGLGKSVPVNDREKVGSPARSRTTSHSGQTFASVEASDKSSSVRSPASGSEKKMAADDYYEPPNFDTFSAEDSHGAVPNTSSSSFVNASDETTSKRHMSNVFESNLDSSDDVWLTVSEIPLFTQPTAAPPPSRPPPPKPPRKAGAGSNPPSYAKKKVDDHPSFPNSAQSFQSPKSVPVGGNSSFSSPIDELEDFAQGRTWNDSDGNSDALSGDDLERHSEAAVSAAAASAAAMKDAMDRAEAKFKHAKEVRERETAKAARMHQEREDKTFPDFQEREFRDLQERQERERQRREEEERKQREEEERVRREREDREREQRRIERERIEREHARQAVERATREARERAAADARARAEKAAVGKVQAEARERAERAAVMKAQAAARERAARAAFEAKQKADREKAEREAREKSEREAKEKEAREKAAAAAAAAASARANQQKAENDLESFFGMGSRANSAPRARTSSSDPFSDSQVPKKASESVRTSVGSTPNIRKTSSSANIVDDLSSIFGGAPSAGGFQEVEGETEERRRARIDRHQRTQERAMKALAEKNKRDLDAQMEQAERHRIAETLDVEIRRWAAGKEGNLRALLSTLQYVLWPECGWNPVSLTDLITGAAVKKVYRKATLCIHPDKVQQKGATLQQKYIAEKVFDLLKEAWNKFNSEELF